MILEVKRWPESQEVIEDPEWFALMGIDDEGRHQIGSSAQARVLMGETVTDEEKDEMGFFSEMDLIFKESDDPKSDAACYIYERAKNNNGSKMTIMEAFEEANVHYADWLDIQDAINKEHREDSNV